MFSTYVVNITGDTPTPGFETLRQAITSVNSDTGPDEIDFSIGTGEQTISPTSPLPALTTPVTINAQTQPGYAGTPLIIISGASAGAAASGLVLDGGNSVIEGLSVISFTEDGIFLGSGKGDSVFNCDIGTNALSAIGDGNTGSGIDITNMDDTIGGAAATERDVISGNTEDGILIDDQFVKNEVGDNVVLGNYIGTNAAGNFALPNGSNGIEVEHSFHNAIGGGGLDQGNLISGNTSNGVALDADTDETTLEANFIGTDITGVAALGNGASGVDAVSGFGTIIGGTTAGMGNIISGNAAAGVTIDQVANVTVEGSYIGIGLTGSYLANGGSGILVDNGGIATIGGNVAGAGNVISDNGGDGITLQNTSAAVEQTNALIEGNIIGLDPAGKFSQGNTLNGISVADGEATIGGSDAADRNIISANVLNGIMINAGGSAFVYGNYIGTDESGDGLNDVGNQQQGVDVASAGTGAIIGGPLAGQGNLISGNSDDGILVISTGASLDFIDIQGNQIGSDATGTYAVENGGTGIEFDSVVGGLIGGSSPGDGNLISGNSGGIRLDRASTENVIQGNRIGTDAAGDAVLGVAQFAPPRTFNFDQGVAISITNGSQFNEIGGSNPEAGNIIAFNLVGVVVGESSPLSLDDATIGNSIRCNSIFSNGFINFDGGIVLGEANVGNDAGDADVGPNNLQNHPVLAPALELGSGVLIPTSLNSLPNTQFIVDYYSDPSLDSNGSGEGMNFIGTSLVTTDANGNVTFSPTFLVNVPVGQYITATATTAAGSPFGDTSPFSPPVLVTGAVLPTLSISNVTAAATTTGLTSFNFTITRSGDLSGTSTVDFITADGTAKSASGDYQPATGVLTFAPTVATETITVKVAADSALQPTATFFVDLSSPANATISSGVGTGTIDEPAPMIITGPTLLTGSVIGTSGSYHSSGNTGVKAFDGNLATYFDAPTASGAWTGLDLGTTDAITQIKFAPRSGWAGRMVGGMFQASNSANFSSGVVTLYTVSTTPTVGSFTTVSVNSVSGYRYVRYIGPSNGYCNVAEIQFFGQAAAATSAPATPAKLAGSVIGTSGSYHNDGNTIAKAVDGNLSTFFDGAAANGNWVGEDLGTAQVVTQVKFAPRSGYASRMIGGEIQASNTADFSSGVITLYTISTAPAVGSLTVISLSNTTAYRYYRYLSPSDSFGNIAELEFDG